MKYDRHGYKPRERVLVVTNKAFYLLEVTKSVKQKHRFPLDVVSLVVTSENDKVLMIRLPEDLMKKDKVKENLDTNLMTTKLISFFTP